MGLILTTASPPALKVRYVSAPSGSAAPLFGLRSTSVASSQNAAALFAPLKLVGFELEVLTPCCHVVLVCTCRRLSGEDLSNFYSSLNSLVALKEPSQGSPHGKAPSILL